MRAAGPHYLLELVQVVLLDALPSGALVQPQLLLQPLQEGGRRLVIWAAERRAPLQRGAGLNSNLDLWLRTSPAPVGGPQIKPHLIASVPQALQGQTLALSVEKIDQGLWWGEKGELSGGAR